MKGLAGLVAVAAIVAGCGGSGGSGNSGGSAAGNQKTTVTAAPGVTDGRLGDAVVARPGKLTVTGHTRKTPRRAALAPSNKHALGAEQNCADADVQPTAANLAHVSDVIFCLMNAMRENNGLPDLTQQSQLAKASVDHSQDMVTEKYFAHDAPDGRDVVARLTQAQYIPNDGDWVVGENLAWGSGALATPRALVNAWMNSPPHRENLLAGDYKDAGMGVVFGTPSADAPDGVTVTTDFGTRPSSGESAAGSTASTGSSTSTAGSSGPSARATAAVKRQRALRRCSRRHGRARRRCVRAARRIR